MNKSYKSLKLIMLLSLIAIISIFAGFTVAKFMIKAENNNTARVAMWNINANEVTMNLFNNQHSTNGDITVLSDSGEGIIAPGTNGSSLFSIVNHDGDIAPEVMYRLEINLDDSLISDEILNNPLIQWKLDDGDWGTWDQLKSSILNLSGSETGIKTYGPGEFVNAFEDGIVHEIHWQWLIGDDNIEMDTEMGNLADTSDITAIISVSISAKLTNTIYENVTEGAVQTVNVNEEIEDLTFKSSEPIGEFKEVQINGEIVDSDNYTVTEGSTIVTLKAEYIETLPLGNYTFAIVSLNKTAVAKINITNRTSGPIIHNGTIPEGGTYYKSVTSNVLGNYEGYTAKYEAGDEFPEISNGDVYVYGDYEYRYNYEYNVGSGAEKLVWIPKASRFGWGVKVLDTTKSSYGDIITTINNENIISLRSTFINCKNLIRSPEIPKTVEQMYMTYMGLPSLIETPVFPNKVYIIDNAFSNCTSLVKVNKIPNSVIDMDQTFLNCTSLTEAPIIPSSVTEMNGVFYGCTGLKGTVIINATPKFYRNALFDSGITSISGTCKNKKEILEDSGIVSETGNYIPEGAIYYRGVTDTAVGKYSTATATYIEGNAFPDTVQASDVYVYGDYEYRYNMEYDGTKWIENTSLKGWGVRVLDNSKSEYSVILTTINGEYIVSLSYTFASCESLVNAPVIPDSVTNMNSAFRSCDSLVNASVIPSSVTNMNGTFAGCLSLVNAPVIPNSVTNISGIFWLCTSLTGTIEINANPTSYKAVFNGTTEPIILIGSSSLLNEIAATSSKGNVKVGIIPEGGIYYKGVTSNIISNYSGATSTLTAGQEFPETISKGDVYVYGDYEYRYNMYFHDGVWNENPQIAWGVRVLDTTKSEYGEILTEIMGKKITTLTETFKNCVNLINAPAIPNRVTNIARAFWGCTSLETAPVIPNSVIGMDYAFNGCTSLINAPAIPSSVTGAEYTFAGCTSLIGSIEINTDFINGTGYTNMLKNTQITEITGTCTIGDAILEASGIIN